MKFFEGLRYGVRLALVLWAVILALFGGLVLLVMLL